MWKTIRNMPGRRKYKSQRAQESSGNGRENKSRKLIWKTTKKRRKQK